MRSHGHQVCIGLIIAATISYVALAMENNDSRLLYIPKQEFLTVISGIIITSNNALKRNDNLESINIDGNFSNISNNRSKSNRRNLVDSTRSAVLSPSPRTLVARRSVGRRNIDGTMVYNKNENSIRGGVVQVKRDSFYFLQKSLEQREEYNRQSALGENKQNITVQLPNPEIPFKNTILSLLRYGKNTKKSGMELSSNARNLESDLTVPRTFVESDTVDSDDDSSLSN